MANENIFQSARLVYRAVEPTTDDQFFQRLTLDRVGYQNSSYSNIHLAGITDATKYLKACASTEDCLLGTVICLPAWSSPADHIGEEATPSKHDKLVPVGEIHLRNYGADRKHHRDCEIGMQLLSEFQRKGYGAEAIAWVVRYAFHNAGLHRVGIKAFEWNEGAIRLYEKCGFVVEGREREALWHDGRWWDMVLMSLLDREWREKQQQ